MAAIASPWCGTTVGALKAARGPRTGRDDGQRSGLERLAADGRLDRQITQMYAQRLTQMYAQRPGRHPHQHPPEPRSAGPVGFVSNLRPSDPPNHQCSRPEVLTCGYGTAGRVSFEARFKDMKALSAQSPRQIQTPAETSLLTV